MKPQSGLGLKTLQSTKAIKLGLMLSAMLLLAGCETTSSTGTKAKCAGLKPITYSTNLDSAETVKQIRVNNEVGRKLGCW